MDEESVQEDIFIPTFISLQPPISQLSSNCKLPVRKPHPPDLTERKNQGRLPSPG